MSASSKKKLRNAQQAEKLTEKQLNEQAEAKKLKNYTTIFVVVLVLLVLFAAVAGISRAVEYNGTLHRKNIAMTVGDHEVSSAELNYFYTEAINEFQNTYGSYLSMLIDPAKPLNEQYVEGEEGETWADYFLDTAKKNVHTVYALNDAAAAA